MGEGEKVERKGVSMDMHKVKERAEREGVGEEEVMEEESGARPKKQISRREKGGKDGEEGEKEEEGVTRAAMMHDLLRGRCGAWMCQRVRTKTRERETN